MPSETRTIRRYSHELYPHPDECEVRTLAVDVPYLYARAIGLNVGGTSWFDYLVVAAAGDRTSMLVAARETAFIADALLQGLAGEDAWSWAQSYASDETGEVAAERALVYGVPIDLIKPYPCGPEPERHEHIDPQTRIVTFVQCRESECPDCTEPVPAEVTSHE